METSAQPNEIYESVRQLFNLQGLDSENFGLSHWNPLGELIHAGERVLLKPNLITHSHPRLADGWRAIMTNGSIIRAVADYAFKAVGEHGEVIVADGPQTDASFSDICQLLGLTELEHFYASQGLRFRLLDLRQQAWHIKHDTIVTRQPLDGDPRGYATVDLGTRSLLYRHCGEGRYYGADYDTSAVNTHHQRDRHEYLISRTALECDVVINLPKLKTHKKTGITLSLKNMVGINGDRNYLPHYTQGTPSNGGDEYADDSFTHTIESAGKTVIRALAQAAPKTGSWLYGRARESGAELFGGTDDTIRSGNWWGNDTCWRMCLDLNRALFYANPDGCLRSDEVGSHRRYLTIIDGIIGGEGNGPIDVDPVASGVLLMSSDPIAADAVAARLMGFDHSLIPMISQATKIKDFPIGISDPDEIEVVSNRTNLTGNLKSVDFSDIQPFRPHFGWRGKIETGSR